LPVSWSFWRSLIGRWLLGKGAAPWRAWDPQHIAVTPLGGYRFSARIVKLR
jgi:hypothetical protein